jgi:membrane associated rhomboid family serine protease
MQWYKRFLEKYGAVGLLMSMAAVAYVVIIILQGVMQKDFDVFYRQITLPVNINTAVRQPWSIFTYFLASHPFGIWLLVVDLVLLYTFGQILNAMLGDRRTQGLILFSLVINAILVMFICSILPTVEVTETAFLFGLHLLNCTLIGAAITLVPRYEFQIIRWKVPLLYVGLVLLLFPLISYRAVFTVNGVATIVGPLMGFVLIRAMQSGNDITRWLQFSVFQEKTMTVPRERIRVHVRERRDKVTVPAAKVTLQDDANELDRLLDKINDVGYNGLSKKEKETLDRLSKHS